ncbi:cytochrome c oxidase subunit 6A, mitochondrial [Cylas formicarius]|uniref:cytochrome c oxidase subunit 6A, mitochondrial n=1 Tax=Cylas formicarius TaxID=197179 RepID=UPI002958B544|nr:cytochrome c oxidase subunit 6A, mitochondrial [Cylas formicarius]
MAGIPNYVLRRLLHTSLQRAAASTVQVRGPSAVSGGHEGGYKVWKNLAFFVAFPSIILCAVNCYIQETSHPHERPPFVKYEYMRVRTKRFPWGDGNKSLFHNPKVNALPDGYEDELEN